MHIRMIFIHKYIYIVLSYHFQRKKKDLNVSWKTEKELEKEAKFSRFMSVHKKKQGKKGGNIFSQIAFGNLWREKKRSFFPLPNQWQRRKLFIFYFLILFTFSHQFILLNKFTGRSERLAKNCPDF